MQAVGHILGKTQNGIRTEEALGQGDAAVSGIVQGTLQPLSRGCHGSVQGIRHQIAGQGANTLRAHRIALIGHGRGTDLVLFKRLFHLTVVLQKPDVIRHPIAALSNRGQDIQDPAVQLPGIGLTADAEALAESKVRADFPVHFVDLPGVAAKKLQEAGLGAGGAPAAEEFHSFQHKIQLVQIRKEILRPESGALAHSDQLRGLIVGVAKGRHGLIGVGEFCQIRYHLE